MSLTKFLVGYYSVGNLYWIMEPTKKYITQIRIIEKHTQHFVYYDIFNGDHGLILYSDLGIYLTFRDCQSSELYIDNSLEELLMRNTKS